jgi:tetratricopeptide (TPR) repeat protein
MSTDALTADRSKSTMVDFPVAGITAFGASTREHAHPNDSYELQDMVSVAVAYFSRGLIDDADDMLQEALSAGYDREDAIDLNRRIRATRLESSGPVPCHMTGIKQNGHGSEFTIPLPGESTQNATVRRAINESESDIAAGRLHSAQDATLHAIAKAPSYYPMYVRLAELRQSLGDSDGAATILTTVKDCLNARDADADWLSLSLRVLLDPSDARVLRRLATSLLELRGTVELEPYVPDAIEHFLDRDPATALELASDYVDVRPDDSGAVNLYLRSLIANRDMDAITRAITTDVDSSSSADLLYLRSAIAHSESRDEWLRWLEIAANRMLANPYEIEWLERVIDCARNILPAPQLGLSAAIVHLAAGDPAQALADLSHWQGLSPRDTPDAREMLLAACARAFALRDVSPVESIEALTHAVSQSVVIDVRSFAASCRMFAHSVRAESLMAELVAVARATGQQDMAILNLQALRDRMPAHLEIRTGLADLQVAAGRVSDGIRELRYIAEKHEQAGHIDRMVQAMRHMSDALPDNPEMKSRLVDGYLQRGIPTEAARELRLLGDLYLRHGRGTDAATAYKRGADIAATIGNVREAMDLIDRAVTAEPGNVEMRHASVTFHVMNGAISQAIEQLREIVKISHSRNDPDEVVAALHQIIGLAPSDTEAYHQLGEVLTTLGEYKQAERVYRRLGTLLPDDPVLNAKQTALSALAAGQ